MTEATKLIRIECTVNPDVHLGDGRALKGPKREGTKLVQHGDVAEVSADIAEFLIERGQVQKTTRPITVE